MGACYWVSLKVDFDNEENKKLATKECIDYLSSKNANLNESCLKEVKKLKTFDDLIKFIFAFHQGNGMINNEAKHIVYSSAFDATYSWEVLLLECWNIIKKYATKSSEFNYDM